MQTVTASALVAYSSQQMFDLVNDVEAYPQFMPGCVGARILLKGDGWVEAELRLHKSGFNQSFTTRNQLSPPGLIHMQLLDGPFSHLEGFWRFKSLSELACKVEFELNFELQNRFLQMATGKMFASISQQQVDAVCRRAEAIYSV
ncbi:MAG: type II toxin-antitoxin system RatA family toxin [Cellvibrio sp.]|nr:type II toxin-antitoxin system RatA family toxin [Cellvibrio sp.]